MSKVRIRQTSRGFMFFFSEYLRSFGDVGQIWVGPFETVAQAYHACERGRADSAKAGVELMRRPSSVGWFAY